MSTTSVDHGAQREPATTAGPPLVSELSAITVDSTDLEAWERFGSEVLGATVLRGDDELRLKLDDYPHRFLIRQAHRDGLAGVSWLARDVASIEKIEDRWERAGGSPEQDTPSVWGSADVGRTYFLRDHLGVVHEVFETAPTGTPFEPTPEVSGYLTGTAGLGHIVFFDDVDEADKVFVDVLALTLRADVKKTQVGGRGHFYGCNPRHHTAAAVEVAGQAPGVMHLMIEMLDIDDVGGALDRATLGGWTPRTSLGRRGDHAITFYVPCPAGFDLEIGCGGLLVDDQAPAKDVKKIRSWGHLGLGAK